MNLLVDQLPTAVMIEDREYPINSDFRACLRVIMAFEDDQLTSTEKQIVLLDNLYPIMPHELQVAVEQALKFLNGGKISSGEVTGPRLYSFDQDAAFIFAAFRQTHGLDLETANLHWWKFLALFMDLGSETTFCGLIGLRKRIKTGTASKEERAAYREMKETIGLDEFDMRTPDEREREKDFLRQVEDGMRAREGKLNV